MQANDWITQLKLIPHQEGGYYRRHFEANHRPKVSTEKGARFSATSIYYMLTGDSPVGFFHMNQSDIIHIFNDGDPISYYLIETTGELKTFTLGKDIQAGQLLSAVVPGGVWKASTLSSKTQDSYGLITEVVVPGFDYADMTLGQQNTLIENFPQHEKIISLYAYR